MKPKKIGNVALAALTLLFLGMNWGGSQLATNNQWPLWLDTGGTLLCASVLGPVCGAIVGAASNLLAHILYGDGWYYAIVNVLNALIAGIAARRKMLDNLLDSLTVAAMTAGCSVLVAYPLNLILNSLSTGNPWGDAVMYFLGERGMPLALGLGLGLTWVEMLDKLTIMVVIFLLRRASRLLDDWIGKRREAREERENGMRTLSLLVAAGMGLSALGMAGSAGTARAEEAEQANINDYVQTVYSTSNGLPCGEANDIAMTGDGIIWIGTYAGLYRYNGSEFRWMDSYDSVRNVNCLYVDEEGRLWVGTNDNGLSILIGEEVVNVIDQQRGLPANSVKSIIKSTDGYYYIGTTGSMQILTLNSGLKQLFTLSEVSYADHIAAGPDGYVAAITNQGTLFLMRQGQIVASRRLHGTQADFKSCMFTPEGELLAATTGDEIYRFSIGERGLQQRETVRCPGLQNIKTLYRMEDGTLFVCADNGIGCFPAAGGEFEQINTNDFNNSIDNMLVDYQGNLWFTSSRLGLLRLAPSNFRDIYSTAGMDARVVNAIVQWQGKYYFGTDKGMDAVDLAGKNQLQDAVTERLADTRIRCMMVDREDHLWVCTYSRGLVELLPDGTEYQYNHANGAFGNRARTVQALRDGTVLAAGDTGLSFIRDHQVETTITRTGGVITSMVMTILEREDGTVLVGTDGNGIAVLQDRQVTGQMTRKDGLSSEVILRLVEDRKGGGVFIVTSNGLCYLNAQGSIRKLDNFPYYNNYDIWMKDEDSLFVLSSAGIYTVDRMELLSGQKELNYDLLDTRRGLNDSLTANSWTWFDRASGELYLSCDTGVYVLDTNRMTAGSTLYRMKVNTVRVDGKTQRVERNEANLIPREANRVEIMPEVINYTIQDPTVGYMLEGFDTGWTLVARNNLSSIVYTNLPAGDFTFHLAVFDSAQENILAERTYLFRKEKEMYDNPWFILYLLIVPAIVAFWFTFLMARRRARKIQAELERAQKEVEMGRQTVSALARTVDAKDTRTAGHSRRVAMYSKAIAAAYGLPEKDVQDIEWAASMHDIGKIAIPDAILNKKGRLTDEEYAKMKSHTTEGAKILEGFTLLDHVIEGTQYHHERYDGKGYPSGLKGDEIPLYARIIGVADAFDAMTANRVYRQQMDFDYVLGELERGKGTQFDPVFDEILLKLIREGQINLEEVYRKPDEVEMTAEDKALAAARAEEDKAIAAAQKAAAAKGDRAAEGKQAAAGGAEQNANGAAGQAAAGAAAEKGGEPA